MWMEFMEPGGEHAKLINFFKHRLNGDEQSAADCLQETLVRFFWSVERGTFDYRRKVMPYLWRIAVNVLNDFLRSSYHAQRIQRLDEENAGNNDWADPLNIEGDMEADLLNALDHLARRAHLSEFQRQVIHLCHVQQLKPREAAHHLQVPARKVSNELFRARKKIRAISPENAPGKGLGRVSHLPLGE
jgi:RNA polymerase sigma factor (sigma-70 family)